MQHRANPAEVLCQSPGGLQAAQSAYADLDAKLREVGAEIDKQHASIVGSRTQQFIQADIASRRGFIQASGDMK